MIIQQNLLKQFPKATTILQPQDILNARDVVKDVYLDENNLRMLTHLKNNFARLAQKLVDEGKKDGDN